MNLSDIATIKSRQQKGGREQERATGQDHAQAAAYGRAFNQHNRHPCWAFLIWGSAGLDSEPASRSHWRNYSFLFMFFVHSVMLHSINFSADELIDEQIHTNSWIAGIVDPL